MSTYKYVFVLRERNGDIAAIYYDMGRLLSDLVRQGKLTIAESKKLKKYGEVNEFVIETLKTNEIY